MAPDVQETYSFHDRQREKGSRMLCRLLRTSACIGYSLCVFSALQAGGQSPDLAKDLGVTLEWDANPEPEVAGYNVYVGRESRSYDTVIDVGSQTSHRFSALDARLMAQPGRIYLVQASSVLRSWQLLQVLASPLETILYWGDVAPSVHEQRFYRIVSQTSGPLPELK